MACGGPATIPSQLSGQVRDRLISLRDNVKIVTTQLTSGTSTRQHGSIFSRAKYWSDLVSRANLVSDWCTKLAVFFSKPPAPKLEECGPVIHGIENSILTLVSAYYSLPPAEGATLNKEVQKSIIDILNGVEMLSTIIITNGCSCESACLKETGGVWNSCEKISRLSKDNKAATLRVFIDNLKLLKDACSELEEVTNGDGMDELELALGDGSHDDDITGGSCDLTDDDKLLIQSCTRLVKCCPVGVANISRSIAKYGDVTTSDGVDQLDAAATVVVTISPCVDDVVTSLYPPINQPVVVQSVTELKDTMLQLVEKCRNFDFCKAANFLKFDDMKKELLDSFEAISKH